MEELSPYIKDQIISGNAILFLGAGASMDAVSDDGKQKGLSGNQLRDKLSDHFLAGKSKNKTLSYVSSLAINTAGMGTVHRYIETLAGSLQPTKGHKLIRSFKWKAIVTTNYDYLVEKSYEGLGIKHQQLHRLIWDRDDFAGVIRLQDGLPFLKLHGCLSRINDPELPLILTGHDYYKFKKNRESLFNHLREWGRSHPIVFCGYSISDENIRDLLFDVSEPTLQRPKYVLVDPSLEIQDIDFWKGHRFDCLPLSFSAFMESLNASLPQSNIALASLLDEKANSVKKLIPTHIQQSKKLQNYLENELSHIYKEMPIIGIADTDIAKSFYKGNSSGFEWVNLQLDVYRNIIDILINDVVLDSGKNASERPYFYILNGYAGSGKSVALKRFAWESGVTYDSAVFYLNEGGVLRVDEILELATLLETRIYIVLDDALKNKTDIISLITIAKKNKLKISIVAAARSNEWNVNGGLLEAEVSLEYELLDLTHLEIQKLLDKLTAHKCLGYLETLQAEERFNYLRGKLKSQLLVALHEATEGKNFSDIVFDEYEQITPIEAKLLYLDICTLDRFDVGVRAGLLSRISGITFSNFTTKLLAPLEHVVSTYYDHRVGDYIYRSRHHQIAEFVFSQAVKSASERAQQIIRIIRYLNSSYESDRQALSQLVKGRVLASEFTDKSLALSIFGAALESGVEAAVIQHQRVVFEMYHPGGDLRAALNILNLAEKAPGTLSLKTLAHTRANLLRRLAVIASTQLEKTKLRQDSLTILNRATQSPRDALPFVTKGHLLLEDLREKSELLDDIESEDADIKVRVVDELSKQIELTIQQGLRAFPAEEKLLLLEAEFSKFLRNTPRALRALERAYDKNKDGIYTAIRLARQYFLEPDTKQKAIDLIRKIVSSHQTSKEAHFELAKMLLEVGESANEKEIEQHLKRSFSTGDTHYEARYLYARHQYLYGNREIGREEFLSLSRIGLQPALMNRVRSEVKDTTGAVVKYQGSINSIHESFAFLRCAQFPGDIFMHFLSMTNRDDWSKLTTGTYVIFSLGFSYKGPAANKVQIKNV